MKMAKHKEAALLGSLEVIQRTGVYICIVHFLLLSNFKDELAIITEEPDSYLISVKKPSKVCRLEASNKLPLWFPALFQLLGCRGMRKENKCFIFLSWRDRGLCSAAGVAGQAACRTARFSYVLSPHLPCSLASSR